MKLVAREHVDTLFGRPERVGLPAVEMWRILERSALFLLICVFWGLVLFAALSGLQ